MHHAPEATPAAWPLSERLSWLKTFRRGVAAHERELCDLASAETGKPRDETLTTDILPLVSACAWLEKHAKRILKPRGVGGKPMWLLGVRVRIERAPIGRVGIIATWNYPYSLLGQQLCEALIAGSPDAGNTVAVKPSERCPKSQRRLLELAQEAGLPEGVLKVWHHDRDAGRKLVEEGDLDHVVFTGSTAVGRTIAGALGPRLVPSSLELSGRDSAIVLADADVRLAARTIWAAVTLNRGQTCMAPRRAIVDRAVYPAFVEALAERARGVEPAPLIDADAAERVRMLIADAIARGGRDLASSTPDASEGASVRPAAVADCPPDTELFQGSHFGPALAITPADSQDDAIELHGRCDQRLATSVFTRSPGRHKALAQRLGSTSVTFNDCIVPTAHPGVPIGGIGPSGWGLTQGAEGLLAMTRPVVVSTTRPRLRLPAGPVEEKRAEQLAAFLRRRYGR